MSRVLVAIALTLAVLAPLNANASEKITADTYIKSFEYRSTTNKAFLDAVRKIIGDDKEAAPYFRMAEEASRESYEHFGSGDYAFAIEDIGESNQLAVHALIIAMNKDNPILLDYVIKEELLLQIKHDIERKEGLLRKGLAEVEVFIKTAERLRGDTGNEEAAATLEKARAHYEASQLHLSQQNFDEALAEVRKAYNFATQTVKDIKRSQDDIITFPKPAFNDEKEILAYELKKNDSYVFFSSKVVKEDDERPRKMLKAGTNIKNQALASIKNNQTQEAIKQLQESTELFIKAIKLTYKEE